MKHTNLLRSLIATGLFALITANTAFAGVVNERDPEYQYSMDRLLAALHSMEISEIEIAAARRIQSLPGFNYDLLIKDIKKIQSTLKRYVTPHKRAIMYRTIRPNNRYFIKPKALIDENSYVQNKATPKE